MWNQINIMSTGALALCILFAGVTGSHHRYHEQHIMGGTHASISDVPFIASIFVESNKNYYESDESDYESDESDSESDESDSESDQSDSESLESDEEVEEALTHLCGGTVISTRHILSAAHCFVSFPKSIQYEVRLGSYGGIVISVMTVTLHPIFKLSSFTDADIAILKLRKYIPLGDNLGINAAMLPFHEVTSGQILTEFAWRTTKPYGPPFDSLQKVDIPVVSHDVCYERYRDTSHQISSNMFCAGYLDIGGVGVCHGDSGTPLVEDGVLHGIVSYAKRCTDPYYPSVFTAVVKFVPWILSNIHGVYY